MKKKISNIDKALKGLPVDTKKWLKKINDGELKNIKLFKEIERLKKKRSNKGFLDKIKLTLEISKKEKIYKQKVQEWDNLTKLSLNRYTDEALNSPLDHDYHKNAENAYKKTDSYKKLKKELKEAADIVEKTFAIDKDGNLK